MQPLPELFSLIVYLGLLVATPRTDLTIIDDLGRPVTLHATARRIISLAPSITETLFALGAGDDVMGVTDFCNYPPAAKEKQRVGGITNPSLETMIDLKPDLIILSMEGNVREDFNKLAGIGVSVFVTNPRTLAGIHKSIHDIGLLTGRVGSALSLIGAMQHDEDSIRLLAKSTNRVLLIVSLQPLIVVGGKTFLAELLELAGGTNIAGTSPFTYPTLSRETVVAANPDVIIVMSDALNATDGLLGSFPEWKTLNAFRSHRVFRVDSDIVSRPGPRATDALIHLYRIIHEGHE